MEGMSTTAQACSGLTRALVKAVWGRLAVFGPSVVHRNPMARDTQGLPAPSCDINASSVAYTTVRRFRLKQETETRDSGHHLIIGSSIQFTT